MQNNHIKIIEGCMKGNQKAQMQLYNLYSKAMFNVACRYFKNKEDAKDAMQEGFLKAFKNIENYTSNYSFGVWLKRIIINQCIDSLRKRKIEFTNFDDENVEIVDDENWSFNVSISKENIVNAIEQLTEKYKIVIKLYLIEGYDHEEISQILNIPVKTSRTQLSRGKLQLRKLLKTEYNEARY